ncbi:N-acetylneuraminate 7-O(or 9-O)-acetyltransferase [Ascochyta rabiei]|uniref:N-acetylneuraminate 7-O(or 9-O)-acetyltransferase n=1 Tax=Didymella rabiei TaxID=5454 RepID=UPI0021FC6EC4|nr:N-acetylneuraminate 7-O(or 9-O)-acetyltransferase [Ascochyta rabiei]UPX16426.1 N-acetylneuraminate 7-O(or 9-O)-acetyltransferase [Ascochyta rabiei]
MLRLRLARPASLLQVLGRVAPLLLLTVVCANVYRRLVHDTADLYKCSALLHQGQWLDSPDRSPERKPFQNWQVPGCLLHDYTKSDLADCSEDGQMLFVGDTTVRQVFWAAAKKLDSLWVSDRQQELDKHEDLHLEKDGARLTFLWDPLLNSTEFSGELKAYMERNKPRGAGEKMLPSDGKRRSVLLFIGGGLWHARHLGDEYLPTFNRVVDRVAAVMSTTHDRLTSPANIRAHGKDGVDDQIFFAPVPDPLVNRLSPSREVTISQNKIWAMNDHLQLWSNRGLNVPWIYRDMTAKWPEMVGESGLHVTDRIATQMADVVLNYRCNAKAAQKHGYPFTRTCCSAYRPVNSIQLTMTFVLSSLFVLVSFGRYCRKFQELGTLSFLSETLAVFLLAAVYCFIADRTHIFDKIPKEFANVDFRVMLGTAVLVCLMNIRNVSLPVRKNMARLSENAVRLAPFLPRDQSDEFKGWMQIYVLVYAYTGASDIMDFYKVFRVFVALYLFLSGYGHATYFLRTNDFSYQRVLGVVLRLNTPPVLLALALDRPYTSYHFAPLVTFWFIIIYLTLRINRSWNECFGLLVFKVVLAALLVTMFSQVQGILEMLATFFNIAFRANVNVDELRYHLCINRYIVFLGVVVSALHIKVHLVLNTSKKQLGPAGFVVKHYFFLHRILLLAAAIITIPTFWIMTRRLKRKDDYDWWMPYIAWLPALSFVILRNATSFLQARYSASFAWLGRISFELYLLSQHIWLAGDSKGLLRVGFRYGSGTFLGDKWRDLVILTPIFVWLSWKVHEATKVSTAWLLYGRAPAAHQAQEGESADRDVMELPGWHRADGEVGRDKETGRHDQHDGHKKMMWRVGGVAAAIWLANLIR